MISYTYCTCYYSSNSASCVCSRKVFAFRIGRASKNTYTPYVAIRIHYYVACLQCIQYHTYVGIFRSFGMQRIFGMYILYSNISIPLRRRSSIHPDFPVLRLHLVQGCLSRSTVCCSSLQLYYSFPEILPLGMKALGT